MNRNRRIGLAMLGSADWIGGSEYIRNLALAWTTLSTGEREGWELHLIAGQPLDAAFADSIAPHVAQIHQLPPRLPPVSRAGRLRQRIDRYFGRRPPPPLAHLVEREGFDLLYPITYGNDHTIGLKLPVGRILGTCRWLAWIPDFQHREMPQLFTTAEITAREKGIAILAETARTIVFSSAAAAADFRRYFPDARAGTEVLRFATQPAGAWFAADPLEVQRRFHLPDEFLLVSNQFWQHKDHATLFAALTLLRTRGLTPTLVCTGQTTDYRKPDFFNTLLRQLHEGGLSQQVRILGLIAREEQIQLMRRCLAVVQPSLFEGWSTVLEDARTLGKVVIASDLAVHREQHPPGAVFFTKDSPEALATALAEVLPRLTPGPDGAAEAAARMAAEDAMQNYGRRFLEIVRGGMES